MTALQDFDDIFEGEIETYMDRFQRKRERVMAGSVSDPQVSELYEVQMAAVRRMAGDMKCSIMGRLAASDVAWAPAGATQVARTADAGHRASAGRAAEAHTSEALQAAAARCRELEEKLRHSKREETRLQEETVRKMKEDCDRQLALATEQLDQIMLEADAADLQVAVPSAEERARVRKLNEYSEKIAKSQTEIRDLVERFEGRKRELERFEQRRQGPRNHIEELLAGSFFEGGSDDDDDMYDDEGIKRLEAHAATTARKSQHMRNLFVGGA